MGKNIIALTYTKEQLKEELENYLFDLFYTEDETEKDILTGNISQLFTLAKDGYGALFVKELSEYQSQYLKTLKKARKVTMTKEKLSDNNHVAGLEDLRLFSTAEVCEVLGISDKTLRTLIKNKELKAYKVGRNWKIKRADIEEYLSGLNRA